MNKYEKCEKRKKCGLLHINLPNDVRVFAGSSTDGLNDGQTGGRTRHR